MLDFYFENTFSCVTLSFYRPQMDQLKASKMRVFGLFAVVGDARCIAAAASKAGLLGEGYLWFGTSPSLTDPSGWQDAAGNVVPAYYKLFQARVQMEAITTRALAESFNHAAFSLHTTRLLPKA